MMYPPLRVYCITLLFLSLAAMILAAPMASAQCPANPPLLNYDAGGRFPCTCFIPGEEAGVTLTAPAADYPLEILSVGTCWGSQTGGAPRLYDGAVPQE